jgi:predicted nucleotide-binding protein
VAAVFGALDSDPEAEDISVADDTPPVDVYPLVRDRTGQAGEEPGVSPAPANSVFVVHGRNDRARKQVKKFLRALGLKPHTWKDAEPWTGKGSPNTMDILRAAFDHAYAVVVILTPDEQALLLREYVSRRKPEEALPRYQARGNVFFEAGMALGLQEARTILVRMGDCAMPSDMDGLSRVELDDTIAKRKQFKKRLEGIGCRGEPIHPQAWKTAGDLRRPRVG